MNNRILLLVLVLCIAAVPALTASGDYMGGEIVLGGSGPSTIKITEVPTAAGQVTTAMVPAAVLPTTGSLSVVTTPAGATVSIDGVQRGLSPATIPGLSPGSHTLLLKLDAYEDVSAPVTVTAGQTQTFTSALSPSATPRPVMPNATKKTPGFEVALGFAALGAVFVAIKTAR